MSSRSSSVKDLVEGNEGATETKYLLYVPDFIKM